MEPNGFYQAWSPKHDHSKHFQHLRKSVAPMVYIEDTAILGVALPMKMGVVILVHIPSYSLGS